MTLNSTKKINNNSKLNSIKIQDKIRKISSTNEIQENEVLNLKNEKMSSISMEKQVIDISETQGVRKGKCKWFNVAKGWGFITPNDGGQEIFVHQSVLQMSGFRSLGEQEEVEFECKPTDRGLEATRVSGLEGKDCSGSAHRPRRKKRLRRVRCYNCGAFANHIAAKCSLGPQPKRCHHCKSENHLVADCPKKKVEIQTPEVESDHEEDGHPNTK